MSAPYATNINSAQEPDQTGTGHQYTTDLDSMLEDTNFGYFGNCDPSGPLPGGSDMFLDPTRLLAANMVNQLPDFNIDIGTIPTTFMSHGFNPPISPHMATRQHQWDTVIHFPTSDPSQSNLGPLPLPNHEIHANRDGLAELGLRSQSSNAVKDSQSNIPATGIRLVDGGNGAPRPLTTPGMSEPTTSHNGLQVNRSTTAVSFHSRPEAIVNNGVRNVGPLALNELNLGQGEENVTMPNWITVIKPLLRAGEDVITHRRDNHLALEIILEHLPGGLPTEYDGIKVPATASIRDCADTTGKTLLEFRIHLYGATSKELYKSVCASCGKREGKRRGIPSLIDFKTDSDVIEPKDGKVRIEFVFCCYPKDHQLGDMEYLLEVVLSEDQNEEHVIAQYQLPFAFDVVPRLTTTKGKRKRAQVEQGDHPALDPPPVRRRVDDANAPVQANRIRNEQAHNLAPDIDHQGAPEDAQSCEDSTPSSPPLAPPFDPRQNEGSSSARLDAIKPPNQAIAPPRIDGDCAPTLTEVNPASGSITGGARIWLQGINFPAHFPLFARFGTAVVPTAFSNHILACNLPPATAPGVVDVTLSKHPEPNAPKYGISIARFHYLADYEQLVPMVLRVHAQGYPELLPALETLLTALNGNHGNRGLQGGGHGAGPQDDPIETALVNILSHLQTRPNFHEILSTTNDYHQTFAHLSILYGYPSLLRHLVEWCIDLAVSDINGLTALHCAFLKGDLESVRILRRGGAPENVTDQLGRTPSDLQPEGFGSAVDLNAEGSGGLGTETCPEENDLDGQVVLEEQFSTLCMSGGDDLRHAQSDLEENDRESVAASDEGGDNRGGTSGSGDGQIGSNTKEPAISTMDKLQHQRPHVPVCASPPNRYEFPPVANKMAALNVNVLTPTFEGGCFRYRNHVTAQLSLTGRVPPLYRDVVLGPAPANESQLVLWCYAECSSCISSLHPQCSPVGFNLNPAPDSKHNQGFTLDPSSGTLTGKVTFTIEHRSRQPKAQDQPRRCADELLILTFFLRDFVGYTVAKRQEGPFRVCIPSTLAATSTHEIRMDAQAIADLKVLKKCFENSTWFAESLPEPRIGDVDCPELAMKYGGYGSSCLVVFVHDWGNRTYGCRHERCFDGSERGPRFRSLNDAIRHQRRYHF